MKLLRKRLLIAPIAIWAFTFTYCFSSTVMARQSSGLATLGSLIMMGPGLVHRRRGVAGARAADRRRAGLRPQREQLRAPGHGAGVGRGPVA
jgi:hypothetical protein